MLGSRLKKVAIVAGAGAVATMTTLALNPFSASASGDTPTTTTVLASAHATNGHAVKFTAKVKTAGETPAPAKKAGGTMSFSIVGSDSQPVPCTGGNSNLVLNPQGAAVCKVAAGALTAGASPYTVTATYSGSNTLAGSTGTLSESIGLAPTVTKVTASPAPSTQNPTTFTATVTGGGGLPTGTVTFNVFADSPHGKLVCHKGKTQPLASNAGSPPQMVATCTMKMGWLKLPKASKTNPHPKSQWHVLATYNGDTSYATSSGTKQGTATS
jgi:hypothetical protein